jgi:2-oxoglutarate ferredoxin oxidoreductase subunit gamma
MRTGGLLIIDSDLVTNAGGSHARLIAFPASNLAAHEFGRTIVANLMMLGVLVAQTGVVSIAGMEAAIGQNVPPATIELNLKAFQRGCEIGRTIHAREPADHAIA